MESRVAQIKKTLASLTERLDDQENRGLRCILRIIGLPEKTEGLAVVNFMEKWIPEILYIEMKNRRMKLERAHRIGAPGSERYSCPMIVHLHNFVDRQRVMDTVRQIWEVCFEWKIINCFQDFFTETQRKCCGFDEAWKRLQDIEFCYSLISLLLDNPVKVFNSPGKAMAFINSLRTPTDTSDALGVWSLGPWDWTFSKCD